MIEDITTHVVAAVVPLCSYLFYQVRTKRKIRAEALAAAPRPVPKLAPSDYVIYRYGTEGVESRWVYVQKQDAQYRVKREKARGHTGALFKDGETILEWNS